MRRAPLVLSSLLLVQACVDLREPPGTAIVCARDADCIDGTFCDGNRCKPKGLNEPPALVFGAIARAPQTVSIPLRVSDREGNDVSISWELDSGVGFAPITIPSAPLASSRDGTEHTVAWDASGLGPDYRPTLRLRATPTDGLTDGPPVTSDPFDFGNDPPGAVLMPISGEKAGDVGIAFRLTDSSGDPASVAVQFRLDQSDPWRAADVTLGAENNLLTAIPPETGLLHAVIWNSRAGRNDTDPTADQGVGTTERFETVQVRVVPADTLDGIAAAGTPVDSEPFIVDNTFNFTPLATPTTPAATVSQLIDVDFVLSDPESDSCVLQLEYNAGGGWLPATVTAGAGTATAPLASSPEGIAGTVTWDSLADLVGVSTAATGVRLRMAATDVVRDQRGAFTDTNVFVVDNVAFNQPPVVEAIQQNGVYSGTVLFDVLVSDVESDTVFVDVEVMLDNGSWTAAHITDGAADLTTSPEGVVHTVVWDSLFDSVGASLRSGVELQICVRQAVPPRVGDACATLLLTIDNGASLNQVPGLVVVAGRSEVGPGAYPIVVEIADAESNPVDLAQLQWSPDGFNWVDCTRITSIGALPLGLGSSPTGVRHAFYWDVTSDRLSQAGTTPIRLRARVEDAYNSSEMVEFPRPLSLARPWAPTTNISQGAFPYQARDSTVVVDAVGSLHVAWRVEPEWYYTYSIDDGGTWAPTVTMGMQSGTDLRLAVTPSGTVHAVWRDAWTGAGSSAVDLHHDASDDGWTSSLGPQVLASDATSRNAPALAAPADDRVLVMWETESSGEVCWRKTADGSTWSSVQLLSSPGRTAREITAATDRWGATHATWVQEASAGSFVWYGTLPPDTDTWTARRISQQYGAPSTPAISVDANGGLHAAWLSLPNIAGPPVPYDIRYARSLDGGPTWSSPLTATSSDEEVPLSLAADGGGAAHLLWPGAALDPGPIGAFMYASTVDAGATWSRPEILPPGTSAQMPTLAATPNRLHIVWTASSGNTRDALARSTDAAFGGWTPPVAELSGGDHVSLVAAADGSLVLGYTREGEPFLRISTDGGMSWGDEVIIPSASSVVALALSARSASRIDAVHLAGANDDLVHRRTANGGVSWAAMESPGTAGPSWAHLQHDPCTGDLHAVWKSGTELRHGVMADGASTWATRALVDDGSLASASLSVACERVVAVAYAGTGGVAYVRSDDGGSNWSSSPESIVATSVDAVSLAEQPLSGGALAVWRAGPTLHASFRDAGAWSPPSDLGTGTRAPRVEALSSGDFGAVWHDGTTFRFVQTPGILDVSSPALPLSPAAPQSAIAFTTLPEGSLHIARIASSQVVTQTRRNGVHYASEQVDLPIPDDTSAGVVDTLTLTSEQIAFELEAWVDIAHPDRGDLRVELTHVGTGDSIVLHDRSDAGAPWRASRFGAHSALAPADGSLAFRGFYGRTVAGEWTLTVTDTVAGQTGTLRRWGLVVR